MMYDELIGELHIVASGVQSKRRRELLEKAADAIEELSKRLDESIPKVDAEIIISEVAKPRWIPVTERLPRDNERVLIHSGDYVGCGLYTGAFWKDEDHDYVIVTHWIPLPEPPKEET